MQGEAGMTLWQLLRAGGGSMIVLILLSVVAAAFVIYFFMNYRESVQVPERLYRELTQLLASKKYDQVRRVVAENDNILSRVVSAGLDYLGTEGAANEGAAREAAIREAVETSARTEVSRLWQNLGYLSDVAVIAPLVGLLGTVLGMIEAFNVIAFSSAGVKPILMAGGIAKAMVTTAGGLIVAIPSSFFFSFFRSRVSKITTRVEAITPRIAQCFKRV